MNLFSKKKWLKFLHRLKLVLNKPYLYNHLCIMQPNDKRAEKNWKVTQMIAIKIDGLISMLIVCWLVFLHFAGAGYPTLAESNPLDRLQFIYIHSTVIIQRTFSNRAHHFHWTEFCGQLEKDAHVIEREQQRIDPAQLRRINILYKTNLDRMYEYCYCVCAP